MYCDIGRVDIVAKHKSGRQIFMQTDHRSPKEVMADKDMSVVMKILRIEVAKAMDPKAKIICQFPGDAAEVIKQIAKSENVTLQCDDNEISLGKIKKIDIEKQFNKSMKAICDQFMKKHRLKLDKKSLPKVEKLLFDKSLETDGISRNETILYTTAFMGQLVGKGKWVRNQRGKISPFVYKYRGGELNLINFVDRVHKQGQGSLANLLKTAEGTDDETPPSSKDILPLVRHKGSFPSKALKSFVWEPLTKESIKIYAENKETNLRFSANLLKELHVTKKELDTLAVSNVSRDNCGFISSAGIVEKQPLLSKLLGHPKPGGDLQIVNGSEQISCLVFNPKIFLEITKIDLPFYTIVQDSKTLVVGKDLDKLAGFCSAMFKDEAPVTEKIIEITKTGPKATGTSAV